MADEELGRGPAPHCSFCGKARYEVAGMIAGPGVQICNECVELCRLTLAEQQHLRGRVSALRSQLRDLLHRLHLRYRGLPRSATELAFGVCIVIVLLLQAATLTLLSMK